MINLALRIRQALPLLVAKRSVHKEIRKKMNEKTSAKVLALEYFDFYYGSTFGPEWNPIRLAMLTGVSKPAALINNFAINSSDTMNNLEKQTAIDLFKFAFNYYQKVRAESNGDELVPRDQLVRVPETLKLYSFDLGDMSRFRAPKYDSSVGGVLDYYCLDGASVLPVVALDLKKDDVVLDLCASPGGKSLAILQTLLPKLLVCRDSTVSRVERLERTLKSYIPGDVLQKRVNIQINDVNVLKNIPEASQLRFDKVLVDAPCTNDRESLFKDLNNMFSRSRVDERSEIPKQQTDLLTQAVNSCKTNGSVVYSTCSLSPIQNEGVVNTVLTSFDSPQYDFKLRVDSLDAFKGHFSYFYKFSSSCKTGLLVVPDISRNFGPLYICKISKLPRGKMHAD